MNTHADDWVITLSYPISEVAPVDRVPLNSWLSDAMESWETALAPIDASVFRVPDRGVIDVTAYHSGQESIIDTITLMVSLISRKIGMSDPEAIEVVRESEHQRRADEPTMPELMSAAEIADELGISRQRVHQLRDTEAFPAPLADLRGGAVWDAKAIRKFNEGWERKPGRPKKNVIGGLTAHQGGVHIMVDPDYTAALQYLDDETFWLAKCQELGQVMNPAVGAVKSALMSNVMRAFTDGCLQQHELR